MIVCVVDDLLFSVKISTAAKALGVEMYFERSAEMVVPRIREKRPSLVIFDLNSGKLKPIDAVLAMKQDEALKSVPTLGFVSHVDAETIARSIHLPGWLPRGTYLTTRPSPPTPTNIRVVLAFQPSWRGVREEWLCDSNAKLDLAPGGGKVVVAAALCVDAKPVAWLQGDGESAASPAAKSFQNLMNQVMANLLPDREL